MTDWFTEFADSLGKGKVLDAPLDYRKQTQDAVFDFHYPDVEGLVKTFKADGTRDYEDGKLRTPFPAGWYVWEIPAIDVLGRDALVSKFALAPDAGIAMGLVVVVMRFWQTPEGDLNVETYNRIDGQGGWFRHPLRLTIRADGQTSLFGLPYDRKLDGYMAPLLASQQRMTNHAAFLHNTVMALTYVLAQPRTHTIDSVATPKAKNQLRRARGLAPLPPVMRRVMIDVTWLRSYVPKGGTHASPVPHERKAHKRKLANGVVIDISACKVRGGGSKPRVVVSGINV